MTYKICTLCNEGKNLEEFYTDKRTKNGRTSRCKNCLRTSENKKRQCPKVKKERCKKEALRRYSISEDLYYKIKKVKNCQCCSRKISSSEVCIDHCHISGTIRGVLCSTCNLSIGGLGDTMEGVQKALNYLKTDIYGKL